MKAFVTKIAYYLPEKVAENTNARLKLKTGIERRHIAAENETAADLAASAAEKIFADFPRGEIDYILFCTQSPDYFLPATACILQDRLKLPKTCGAADFNQGCSGYIYGLSFAKALIESGQAKNVLLLTGETYSKYINPRDNAVLPLFGDAGTATIISARETETSGIFATVFETDGGGFENLIVPVGGARNPYRSAEIQETADKFGNIRTNANLFMDGGAIMDFALETVPRLLEKILAAANLTRTEIDYYVFHQANNFMLGSLQKLCKLESLPFRNDVRDIGNTVSNSIPIALADLLSVEKNLRRVLPIGFGVGLSSGGCVIDVSKLQ